MDVNSQDYNYEKERQKLKLGTLATCVLLFKSTVGVGVFTYQFAFAKAGFFLAVPLSALIFYMIIYGMHRLLQLCDMIELHETIKKRGMAKELRLEEKRQAQSEPDPNTSQVLENNISVALTEKTIENLYEVDIDVDRYQIVTFHQVPNQWSGKLRRPLVGFSIFAVIGMGLGFACGNYMFLINCVNELTGLPHRVISCIILVILMVEIKLIVEPEKIKPVAFTLVVVIFGIATVLLMSNYAYFFINHDRMISNTYNYFNIGESGMLIGISMFSFESINTVVNVRRTTKQPQLMTTYVRNTFILAGSFYVVFALSYHLVYGTGLMKKVAFDYYITNKILHSLKFFVMLNPFFSIPFNIISSVELFEKVRPLSFLIRNEDMSLSGKRILRTRFGMLFILFLLTLISKNIAKVLDFVGSMFGPTLGLIVPVVVYQNYSNHKAIPTAWWIKLHDSVFLLMAVVFIGVGLHSTFAD